MRNGKKCTVYADVFNHKKSFYGDVMIECRGCKFASPTMGPILSVINRFHLYEQNGKQKFLLRFIWKWNLKQRVSFFFLAPS